jgi:hypothetical protein
MRDKFLLLSLVGRAAFMMTLACFAPVAVVLGLKIAVTREEQMILGATMILLPTGIAAWWVFRNLRTRCTRAEAWAVATTFAVFAPVSLLIGTILAEITGSYAGYLGPHLGLLGAFAGIVVVLTLGTFVPSQVALWIAGRIGRRDHAQ